MQPHAMHLALLRVGTRPLARGSSRVMGGQNATFAKALAFQWALIVALCSCRTLNQPSRDEPGGAGNVSRTGSWSTYL